MKEENQKYRILLVVPYTLPDYAGSGINAFNFARFLIRQGEKATLLTFNRNLKLKSREIIEEVKIKRIPYFNLNMLTKNLSMFIILPAYLIHILRHDIVLIYGAHVIGYQLIISCSRCFGKKVIFRSLMMGTDDMHTILNSVKGKHFKPRRSEFDRISLYFSINPVFAELYKTHVKKPQTVVVSPQGYDPTEFYPVDRDEYLNLREKYQIDISCFTIVSVGFLIPRKGHTEIFETLADLDFDFRLYIVGEHDFDEDHFLSAYADEARKIRAYGEKLLGHKLHLEGPWSQPREYYQMADLVIFNSRQEGISNVLIESMACGKPVLCREIPGLRDYIIFHERNGLLYTSSSEMRKWITKVYRDPDFAMELGTAAADFIHQEANFMVVWQRLLEGLNGN